MSWPYTVDQFMSNYNSFSGVDISAVFEQESIGLKHIDYKITKEHAPLYTMKKPLPDLIGIGVSPLINPPLLNIEAIGHPVVAQTFKLKDHEPTDWGALLQNMGQMLQEGYGVSIDDIVSAEPQMGAPAMGALFGAQFLEASIVAHPTDPHAVIMEAQIQPVKPVEKVTVTVVIKEEKYDRLQDVLKEIFGERESE